MVSQARNASEALQQAIRFDRAKQVLAEGYTFHKDADTEAIAVCKRGSTAAVYWIDLLSTGCDCPDRLKTGKECKHELAYEFLQAEKTEEAGMWESICRQWEEENLPLMPELPEAPELLVKPTKRTFPRPSRYGKIKTDDYELMCSGLVYGKVLLARNGLVQTAAVEEPYLTSGDYWSNRRTQRRVSLNILNRRLAVMRNRIAAGDTAADDCRRPHR